MVYSQVKSIYAVLNLVIRYITFSRIMHFIVYIVIVSLRIMEEKKWSKYESSITRAEFVIWECSDLQI